jgi:hypothetical protein
MIWVLSAMMEAFESFVAVSLEADGFVVSSGVKFPVRIRTAKAARAEYQTHGFEVDLVAARADRLVLASVKSFLGSRGVVSDHVVGDSLNLSAVKRYAILNNAQVRSAIVQQAARRYGYRTRQVELRLYVGRFAGRARGAHEARIRHWAKTQRVGSGPIRVIGLKEVVEIVLEVSQETQYMNDPVVVALKVLAEAGLVNRDLVIGNDED